VQIFGKAVSLLELLRAYAQIYAEIGFRLGINIPAMYERIPSAATREAITSGLKDLREECERLGMEMTVLVIDEQFALMSPSSEFPQTHLHTGLQAVAEELTRELSTRLFVAMRAEHRKFYDKPFRLWEEILKRFGSISRDVEEMNKCFALCRYTAAMYHAMQIAEAGAIELGNYIGVTDTKKGWGPTERRLQQIVKAGHAQLPANLSGKFDFLEQMHREIDSMVLAWRHKLDHAANNLAILPNTDFTPDIAEHIMGAVRIFMIRLMEGLPTN
jgi:hypothetical protein